MILLNTCPICNHNETVKKMDCTDFSTTKELFKIVSCETCGFTFTNPRPCDEELKKYYDSEMYISHTNKKKGLFNWLYQKIRFFSIKAKVTLLEKNTIKGVHLDIGCGTGEFLNACLKNGFITRGIEPSELARRQAIQNYRLDVSENTSLSQFEDNSIDSISMWHVLEHISDLNGILIQFSRILSLKGKIIIAVPSYESWDALYYNEFWAAWDVPIHLWHFSKNTIDLLFKKHGFVLTKTKPMIFDSFYVSLLSEEFKFGYKNYIKSFFIGLISNCLAFFNKATYSSSTYIFERERRSGN